MIKVRSQNMSNSDIQKILYELLETDEINEEVIKEEYKKQQISNEKIQEKIQNAMKKPFKTNSAMKKRIERIFKSIRNKK